MWSFRLIWDSYALFLYVAILYLSPTVSGEGCNSKNYGTNKVVCVCNATYCDEVQAPEQLLQTGNFLQYTSTATGKRLVPTSSNISKTLSSSNNTNTWKVRGSVQYQEMLGFGGAITDAVGINLGTLSSDVRKVLLNQYYGPKGIGYTFVRAPMGGTDFSTRFYTYNDGPPDVALSRFSLAEEDYKYKLPYLRYVKQLSNPRILSAPWSPPVWMMEGRNGSVGYTRLQDDYYQLHAEYFINFLQAYQMEGVDIWGLTVQNEPGDGYYVYFGINSCGYSPDEQRNFIVNNLGPTLQKHGFGNVTILDHDDQRTVMPEWQEEILGDESVLKYVAGTAVHWYFDNLYPASRLTTVHEKFPQKYILYTEASFLPGFNEPAVAYGDWKKAEKLSKDMIEVMNNWVCGWIDWNICLDTVGGPTYLKNYLDSAIIVNASANEFYKQPIFYSMAHMSKFVPPGSKRIQIDTSDNNNIDNVAFLRPDKKVVVVLLNSDDRDKNIVLETEAGGYITVQVLSHSLNTIVYNSS